MEKKMERAPFMDEWSDGESREQHRHQHWTSRRILGFPALWVAVTGAAAALLLLVGVGSSSGAVKIPLPHTSSLAAQTGPMNTTLGFGAVVLLSLEERTDRQDAVSLISSFSGIDITHLIHSTRGETIAAKAKPFGNARIPGKIGPQYLGSWRTHMNAFKYVIDNNLETALILEDDVDW